MKVAEIIIEAALVPNKGWRTTRIDIDSDGAEITRGEWAHGYYQSSEVARSAFDVDAGLQRLAAQGVTVRFEKRRG